MAKYIMKTGYAGHHQVGGAYDRTGHFTAADDLVAFKIAVGSWLGADGKKPTNQQIFGVMKDLEDDDCLPKDTVKAWKNFIDGYQGEIYFTLLKNLTTGKVLYGNEGGDW